MTRLRALSSTVLLLCAAGCAQPSMSNDAFNEGPLKILHGKCPIEVFSSGHIKAEPRKSRPFGCPVYVLQNALQQGKSIRKWDERS